MCHQRAADATVSVTCVNTHMHLIFHLTEAETLHSRDGKDWGVSLLPFRFCKGLTSVPCTGLTAAPVRRTPPQGVGRSLEPAFLGPEGSTCPQSCAALGRKAQSRTKGPPGLRRLGIPPAERRNKPRVVTFPALTNVGLSRDSCVFGSLV